MTTPHEAYKEGFDARKANPTATTWQGIMPYSCPSSLVHSWIDGWRDAAGDYHWQHGGSLDELGSVRWGVEGGRCPYCSHYPLRRRVTDGKLLCVVHPCTGITAWTPDGKAIWRHYRVIEEDLFT